MSKQSFGLIGLAVMGENLALNIERNGFSIAVYNRSREKTDTFMATRAAGKNFKATFSIPEFVESLESPRKILIMVKAGAPVDAVISELKPLLDEGDIIIDGGNSLFTDTDRRTIELEKDNLQFIGMGVSGGEEGALNGPSMMPGGQKTAYAEIEPIVTKIAAQVDDGACVTYIGPGSAGHYVKMVHNGIEYGDMQLIAEAYDLLKTGLGLGAQELHDTFVAWNSTELESFLIEITADIFTKIDEETGEPLVEKILDKAGQKGTGKWTVESAFDLGVPIPTMIAAVTARVASSYKDERIAASKILGNATGSYTGDRTEFINAVRDALYCSKICSYAQGMALLAAASKAYNYNLNLAEISRIWKGGCIIRAGFLDKIKNAYLRNPELKNLLVDPDFTQTIITKERSWRLVVQAAAQLGIAVPAFSASLSYFDSYRRDRLPQNLTQAQRDYFGAHTYERIDKPAGEFFHTEWTK
ncbi:6-phosphogluconate dehydrogenase, decarboxylating [Synechococcus sp. PCC 7502]|uniref:decarboxylating NADP(+)-dependent phosphogluconate dehydrogenase n=1 Tax=Synechococcus sp. PCC 7502 TaxID=1173263 RepID=UPI00029FEA09|nr:decarboxylating NADP(+)-dependent phosphogluconate dehydrogenase [Synechococcus sp. PCC 7502]AFY74050.1 6-phosphogluconate dehydrogenase, decarboxylating [Synechococcus sp. PCC 7502]